MPPKLPGLCRSLGTARNSLSLDKVESRRRVLNLYKVWYRQLPNLLLDNQVKISPKEGRLRLKEIFLENSKLHDARQINELIIRGHIELDEAVNKQRGAFYIWKYFRDEDKSTEFKQTSSTIDDDQELLKNSARVVWSAVFINGANFMAKGIAWLFTGSHSMFAESIHSLADTANQLILAVGIRKSLQSPTADHPYGYHPMRYIAPLISGVGIFCVGCGLSIYHGVDALMNHTPELFISPLWAYGILSFSLVSESTTLFVAIQALKNGAAKQKITVREYIATNNDPGVIVVFLEDLAAVLGIGIAATCMTLSSYYNTHVFDACGSLMIGSLLGMVAAFIIKKNTVALVGKSIPRDMLNNINRIIEKDIMIRAIHDVKATDLGNGVVRYKAEVDVDGRELSRKYLEQLDLKQALEEIRAIKSEKDVKTFLLTHGEGVVDILGSEIDRIEKELRRSHPKVKHVDLEVL